jgi:nicotinate-nucleotide pyrophosphorylase (carboxylating)
MDLSALISAAVDEDLGPGDVTTLACVPEDSEGTGLIRAKQDLVLCGLDAAWTVFAEVARRLGTDAPDLVADVSDGSRIEKGTVVAEVTGGLQTLLIGERVALNLLMKLSGIATNVARYVEAAGPNGPRVVDTRKTTPLLRSLEKYAVRCGGGHNHRFALYDGAMVKDNHIAAAGGLKEAVAAVRERAHHLTRIEVEARTLTELGHALATDADVIMLDNMDNETLAAAIEQARATRPVVLEASGNITPERLLEIRHLDLDVVSAGGLIHQAVWVDLSMKLDSYDFESA